MPQVASYCVTSNNKESESLLRNAMQYVKVIFMRLISKEQLTTKYYQISEEFFWRQINESLTVKTGEGELTT